MNMFKSRRKAKEQADTFDALTGATSPTTYKSAKSLRRKNKNEVEEKPVFDLSSALPDSNEFRTSLLMPNLSARFSMLREQDDPNTKLGKASDDSVLFPKRASRLNLFNNTPLADVAEVESIYSFRPPFADRERSNSITDGYDSDGGSIMNRSRPGEGNVLFGGRQKLYRIPTGSTKNLADADGTIAGRHVYNNDVSLSLFQQYRQKNKELGQSEEENRLSVPATDAADSEVASPATAFSKNRGTQSSTNSAPRRSSTAATSVVSDSMIRNSGVESVKTSEDPIDNTPQSSSPAIPRGQESTLPTRFLSQSKSSYNIGERFQRQGAMYPPTYRNAGSPSPLPVSQPLDFGFKNDSRSNSATGRYGTDSPTPNTDGDDVLASALQPSDRGKATAMGLFNKPAKEFDEHQFNQRQRQMHEENLSSLSNSRSASRASTEVQKGQHSSGVISPDPVLDNRTSTPQVPPVPEKSESPVPNSHRASRASGRSTPPRPRSKSSASATATANVKARVESLIRKQNAELAALEAEKLGTPETNPSGDLHENKEYMVAADVDDESDYEDLTGPVETRKVSSKIDEADIHPAFRNSHRTSDGQSRRSNYSNFSRTRSTFSDNQPVPVLDVEHVEPQNGFGLSGLIRTHLRHDSDRSSIMPPFEQGFPPFTAESTRQSIASTTRIEGRKFQGDALDLNNQTRDEVRNLHAPPTPTTTMYQTAQQFLSQAQDLVTSNAPLTPNTAMSQTAQQFLSQAKAAKDAADREEADGSGEKTWHDEMEPTHRRGESSETTKERREFDEELAERRRKIREGLKSVTERDRSQSPSGAARGQSVAMQAFVQQRTVTDPQKIKAVRTLGLQSPTTPAGFADDDRGRNTNVRTDRGRGENAFPNFARFGSDQNIDKPSSPRSTTPPSAKFGGRARSNSNLNDRSKSRTRGREPSNPPLPMPRRVLTSDNIEHSNEERTRGRSESNARARPQFPADLNTSLMARSSPKPSPITPHSPYDPDPGRPSPGPTSNNRSVSGSNNRAASTGPFNRKRSVTKTMISEPTFVSSTSSVPLVQLPHGSGSAAPPLPVMNPRRKVNAASDKPALNLSNSAFGRPVPLETVPASPLICDFDTKDSGGSESPSPRKLRKANSEGGSMAAKARLQARTTELANSPAMPMFPNRSATNLDTSGDGAMF